MKLLRIRALFPWRIAAIVALVACLPLLTSWAWIKWELPPLQRYYLAAYWDSSKGAKQSGAEAQIRWLLETAPGRKSRWLIASDVTEGTVVRASGEQTTYDPRRQIGVSVYREKEMVFSVGDRIQFTAPNQQLKIANRDLGTVESIGQDGTMRLRLDDERSVDFNPQYHPHLDHGYAVTSYSSQGQTADRVLVHVDTELACKGPAQQPHGVCLDLARPMGRSDFH